jgi:hypothetical protein
MKPALLVLAVAALLAGCGDDKQSEKTAAETSTTPAAPKAPTSTTPASAGLRPAEPAEKAVARIAKAAQAGDCSAPGELFGAHSGITPKICKRLIPTVSPVVPPEVKTYGSGAVGKSTDGGSFILALDSDRRFKWVTSFGDPRLPKAPLKNADEVMAAVVSAIRRDSCPEITQFSLTYSNGGSGKKFCALRPVRQLHAALDRAPSASPKPLGGDGTFAFYGLKVKPHYYTLIFFASKNGSYFFVTSMRV